MKKIVFIFGLFLSFCSVFAQNRNVAFTQASILIEDNLFDNQLLIEKQALNMSSEERYSLYNIRKKDTTVPFLLNFTLGLGIGSFVQGDTTGGIIGLVGDLGSSLMLSTGYILVIGAESEIGVFPLVLGAVGSLGIRIFELVRPFSYTKKFNQILKESLFLDAASIAFTPNFNTNSDQLAFSLGMRLAL